MLLKSKRIKTGNFEEGIYFKIDRVQGKLENESFDAKKTRKWHKR